MNDPSGGPAKSVVIPGTAIPLPPGVSLDDPTIAKVLPLLFPSGKSSVPVEDRIAEALLIVRAQIDDTLRQLQDRKAKRVDVATGK